MIDILTAFNSCFDLCQKLISVLLGLNVLKHNDSSVTSSRILSISIYIRKKLINTLTSHFNICTSVSNAHGNM